MNKNNNIKVSIITPNLNGQVYLEETIKSVLNQTYKNIEYIIVDGGSTDNSHKIIEKYSHKLSKILISKDHSMYEAIHKGFLESSGQILYWLNSDDLLFSKAIENSVYVMSKNNYEWINGKFSYMKNEKIYSLPFPYYFPKKYIYQGKCHKGDYGFIPQESVIFSRNLYFKSGFLDTNLKYAGDYNLWKKFSKFEELNPANIKIGIFRKRKNQLSENMEAYMAESNINLFPKKINFLRIFYSIINFLFKLKVKK